MNEMTKACGTHGAEKRCIEGFWGNLREEDHLENPGIDGDNIKIDREVG
jgi:hypothetical protein